MATTNPTTGDAVRSRAPSKAYDEGYARIFGKKKKTDFRKDLITGLSQKEIELAAARYIWLSTTNGNRYDGDSNWEDGWMEVEGMIDCIMVSEGDGFATALDGKDLDDAIDAEMERLLG